MGAGTLVHTPHAAVTGWQQRTTIATNSNGTTTSSQSTATPHPFTTYCCSLALHIQRHLHCNGLCGTTELRHYSSTALLYGYLLRRYTHCHYNCPYTNSTQSSNMWREERNRQSERRE